MLSKSKVVNLFIIVILSLQEVRVNFLGLISGSELAILVLLPIMFLLLNKKNSAYNKNFLYTMAMFIVWFTGIIISDLYNSVTLSNFLKGIGHPLFILMCFLVFHIGLKSEHNLFRSILIGLLISAIIRSLSPSKIAEFRFGLYYVFLYLILVISYFKWAKYPKSIMVLILLLGLITLAFASRSNFIILFICVVILFVAYQRRNSSSYISVKSKQMIFFLVGAFLAITLIQNVYIFAVSQKVFDDRYQAKFEEQLDRGVPLIFSGRTEIYSSIAAIKDSPIFGHGSWAVNPKYTLLEMQAIGGRVEKNADLTRLNTHRIPAHSFILGTWVYSGLLAALFFVYFAIVLFRGILYFFNNINHPFAPTFIVLAITFVWHLLFSPLGVDKRIFVGLLLAVGGGMWSKFESEKKKSKILTK